MKYGHTDTDTDTDTEIWSHRPVRPTPIFTVVLANNNIIVDNIEYCKPILRSF